MRTVVASVRTRRLLAAGLGAYCLFAIAGCRGDASSGGSADAAVHQIQPESQPDAIPESPGASDEGGPTAPEVDLTAENFGGTVAEAQLAASTVRVTTEIPLPPGPDVVITGDASVGSDSTAYRARIVTERGAAGEVEARVVDSDVYILDHGLDLPESAEAWKLAPLSDTEDPDVRDLQQLVQLTDPAKVAAFYANAQALAGLGYDVVDGVPTWCYRVTLGAETDIDDSRGAAGPSMERKIEKYLPDSYDMKVCLDEQLRPVTTKVMPRGIAIHFSDWGMPVEVEVPSTARIP